ncbi:MAG: hypothetical protein ACM65L_11635 [Microcoleus sp.]
MASLFFLLNLLNLLSALSLVGDTISAADITFAALAAPVLLPPEHPVMVSKIAELPIEMAAVIKELQLTAAGVYALRLYREQRQVQ